MPHIRFDGRFYMVTEQELKQAENQVSLASLSSTSYRFIKVTEIIDGVPYKTALVYTPGTPISFHYGPAT